MDEVAEAHPESSSAIKTTLAAATFFIVLSTTTILTACSGLQARTFDLIGRDSCCSPDTLRVNDGDTVRKNIGNPDVVPHLSVLPAKKKPPHLMFNSARLWIITGRTLRSLERSAGTLLEQESPSSTDSRELRSPKVWRARDLRHQTFDQHSTRASK